MSFKSYTTCVQPDDYDAPTNLELILALLVTAVVAPYVLGPVIMFEVRRVLEYLLNGKLVCLDGDHCAVGQIMSFEPPSSKSFPDSIDNDFSINLLLYPNTLGDFIGKNREEGYQIAAKNIQGRLITEQPGMPKPRDPETSGKRYVSYPAPPDPVSIDDARKIGGWDTFAGLKGAITVPFFHCECEGSRIHDMLKTLEDVSGLGTGICRLKVLGFPVGKIACSIVATFLAPLIAVLLAIAWLRAQDGNADDARTGGRSGELKPGNMVVVTGRWVYDAGHQGWNELHPVKSIQKIAEGLNELGATGDPAKFIATCCALVMQIPPPDRNDTTGAPPPMTPAQHETWDNQREPQNRWGVHPVIDGCLPPEQPAGPHLA